MSETNAHLKTYKVTLSLLNNEVMLNWQRANISLLGHSIFILAWATIYGDHPEYRGVLTALLVFGGLLCCLWFGATLSGNTYHEEWLAWLSYLEAQPSSKSDEVPMDKVWDQHYKLLSEKKIKIGQKDVTLWSFALGVKDYFKALPILFIAIYFSLFIYLWYPWYIRICVGLAMLGLVVWWFIWIPWRNCKYHRKNEN